MPISSWWTGAGTSTPTESSSSWIIPSLPSSGPRRIKMLQSSSSCSRSATQSWWRTKTVILKSSFEKCYSTQMHRKLYWYKTADIELDTTSMYGFVPFLQVNWCTRLPLLMRAPWWRLRGTSATCFCLARRTPSPSGRWITRQPTKCWPCSTSTRTASACLSSVRVHRHTHTVAHTHISSLVVLYSSYEKISSHEKREKSSNVS